MRGLAPLFLFLLACGAPTAVDRAPYLGLLFSGDDADELRTYMWHASAVLNQTAGCPILALVESRAQMERVVEVLVDQARMDRISEKADGLIAGTHVAQPPTIYLAAFLTPAVSTPNGFDPGHAVGAPTAEHPVGVMQRVFLHEVGHALGVEHQQFGIMKAVADVYMSVPEAAFSLVETLDILGVNPCRGE